MFFFFKKLHSVWETSGRQREGVGSVLDAGYAYLTHTHTKANNNKNMFLKSYGDISDGKWEK